MDIFCLLNNTYLTKLVCVLWELKYIQIHCKLFYLQTFIYFFHLQGFIFKK